MAAYFVEYYLHKFSEVKGLCVAAKNKVEAYDKACYEEIPKLEGELPYSAWVSSVTYQNGNCRQFNTFSGNPY